MLSVYTHGSQPAQYIGPPGRPIFYGPWGQMVEANGQTYSVTINGVKYPVIPNPHLPYPYVIPSYF